MDVSENSGTLKSPILIGLNHSVICVTHKWCLCMSIVIRCYHGIFRPNPNKGSGSRDSSLWLRYGAAPLVKGLRTLLWTQTSCVGPLRFGDLWLLNQHW